MWKSRWWAVAAAVVLAGCSASAPATTAPVASASTPATETASPVSLTLWQFGSPGTTRADGSTWEAWWATQIGKFESANPGIQINFAEKGAEAGGTTLAIDAAVAAGAPPDIYLDVVFRESKYAGQKLLEPMTDVLATAQWSALEPTAVKAVTSAGGSQWGIPVFNTFPAVLAINKTLVDAAGATALLPTDPGRDWTTDQYVAFLKAVSHPPTTYGTMFYAKTPSSDYWLNGYAGAFGAQFYANGNYCQSTISSPQGVQWMQWMNSLISQGLVVPGAAGLTDDDLDAAWSAGKIAVAAGGLYQVALSQKLVSSGQVKTLDVYLANYPHATGLPTTPPMSNAPWAVTVFKQSNPAKLAAAKKFVQFMTSESVLKDFAAGWGYIPIYSADASSWAGSDPNRQFIGKMVAEHGLQDMGFGIQHFTQVRSDWADTRQALWSGGATPDQALANFAAEADKLLCGQ